jgi:20S proteasome alpha/beta subunit
VHATTKQCGSLRVCSRYDDTFLVFQGGIIAAVDWRASLGSLFVETMQRSSINSHTPRTMAGGAADCSFLFCKPVPKQLHELTERRMSVVHSRLLSDALYQNRGLGSVGWHHDYGV